MLLTVARQIDRINCPSSDKSDDNELSDHGWSDNEEEDKNNTNNIYYDPSLTNPTQSQKAIVTSQGINKSQNSKETQLSGSKSIIPTKPKDNGTPPLPVPPNNDGSNTNSQLSGPIEANTVKTNPVSQLIQQFDKTTLKTS